MRSRAAILLALGLAACSSGEPEGNQPAAQPANAAAPAKAAIPSETVADRLGDDRFAQAVKSAGLRETLAGPGPYTVLAPTDEAFARLPAEQAQRLFSPAGRAELTALLSHHILPGTILLADVGTAIDRGNGKALLATMAGGPLTATRENGRVILTDKGGSRAVLGAGDELRKNGVVHRIDAVLVPARRE